MTELVLSVTAFEIITIFALLAGPAIAVVIARHMEDRRQARDRRLHVFRALMGHRRNTLNPDFVAALNLVEVEFQHAPKVLKAWKDLLRSLESPEARRPEEEIRDGLSDQEKRDRDSAYNKRLGERRNSLTAKLLHAIAQELKIKIEQFDIFEGGYSPQGWANVELQQWAARELLTQIYLGKRALPIDVVMYREQFVEPQAGRGEQLQPEPAPDGQPVPPKD